MKIFVIICGFLFVSASAVALYAWARPHEIRHYTESELVGLSCAEISEKNEETIFAYHDASIEKHKRAGSFEGGVGLPEEDVLPFIILMKKVIQDNDLTGLDLSRPFFHSSSVSTPKIHAEFYAEITSVCAKSPSRDAIEAMMQAAKNLKLARAPENS
ncbi:hypothetical protein RZ532_11990 [Nitratireductor aquimarinus]|uniref:hypothetical protein n=1 Tax=Nitratireductor aquimarinus TaxID=889300 RepID=UPI002936D1F9|nr:hypothetical protein [Nitratireductor aquimarinus]MDV2966699.1 hypothetical protein [Nitratireductor aquimarinus]